MYSSKIDDWNNPMYPQKDDIKTVNTHRFWAMSIWLIFLWLLSQGKVDLKKIWDSYSQATEVIQSLIDKTWDAICRSLQP